jgi:N-methylhydantoinase B/oxoprolinase/acetone carboxylase alpha subunit
VAISTRRDPLTYELVKSALTGIADSMAVTVVRTARSFVVKQSMDFSTALCDLDGEMTAQGLCAPLHLGAMTPALQAVLARYGDPLARDPERVADDVREEKLSVDYARREYGVVLDPATLRLEQRRAAETEHDGNH